MARARWIECTLCQHKKGSFCQQLFLSLFFPPALGPCYFPEFWQDLNFPRIFYHFIFAILGLHFILLLFMFAPPMFGFFFFTLGQETFQLKTVAVTCHCSILTKFLSNQVKMKSLKLFTILQARTRYGGPTQAWVITTAQCLSPSHATCWRMQDGNVPHFIVKCV